MTHLQGNIAQNKCAEISMLRKRQDFLRIASGRIKWVSGSMIVQMAATPEGDEGKASEKSTIIRVGYTASKKVGNAVMRNRAKRRLREVVRRVLPEKGQDGHDYVLIARSVALDIPFDHLIRDFGWCLKRLGQSNDKGEMERRPGKKRGKAEQLTRGGGKK